MILKYVLKNFRRRKVRTILMVLSLLVSTGLIVTMSATVETVRRSNVDVVASGTGRYDLSIQKTEISPDPFVEVAQTSQTILDADPRLTAVFPRFQSPVELTSHNNSGSVTLVALNPDSDTAGFVEVVAGEYQLGQMQTAVLENTANTFGLAVGDTVEVAYSFPQPREEGRAAILGASSRRAVGAFTVTGIIRQNGVTDAGVSQGLFIHIDDAQNWLGLPDKAERLIGLVDPALYEARNAEEAALSVRNVATAVQARLGTDYYYFLSKASALDQSAEAFLVLQALINTYGLMALGVVGLLVHTHVMTNVQEQKREMAILRILGSQRNYLFAIVLAEVAVIGALGVGLGVALGQLLTQYAVVPFIRYQMSQSGLTATIEPVVSVTAVLPAIISAIIVLFLSALQPARDAANTKVMHAINPGVADNIQLEDLEALRERRPNTRFLVVGLILMFTVLMTIGLDIVSTFGNPAIEATIIFGALLLMVLGVGFIFFVFTRPLEQLILLVTGLIAPRLTYFARRNVGRGHTRNTLISLLVLFSGVLPSFLATQEAMSSANLETDVRLSAGAPIDIQVFGSSEPELAALNRLSPTFIDEELLTVPGIQQAVGLTYDYRAAVSDGVNMRNGSVLLTGVTGDLNDVLYTDMMVFSAGGPASLRAILADPEAVVISDGLAEALALPLGGTLIIEGEGLDHKVEVTIAGIAKRLPGFSGIGRIRSQAVGGSTVLVSLEGFRRIVTPPDQALPAADAPLLDRILAAPTPDAVHADVAAALGDRFGLERNMWTRLAEVRLEQARSSRVQQQAFLLVLTLISFTTAVFGVFAVIYVTIYARRVEIGMMKAMGTRNRELTGMLIVESIAMTLGAALSGILAGASMAYLFAYADNLTQQRPQQFALDTTVMPFIVIMVVLASMLGATFSARRIIKRKAVEILRMS